MQARISVLIVDTEHVGLPNDCMEPASGLSLRVQIHALRMVLLPLIIIIELSTASQA